VKTSIGKVVEQSISYEITEKYRTESVSFHLKYRLKLTYPVVASAAQAVSDAESILWPDDLISKIQCGELHSKLFGRMHSTLQLDGLFALAKRLLLHTRL